ncbi:MAG: lipopolysaccharide biosynthesis protein, partial [Planctomycetota bacterium]
MATAQPASAHSVRNIATDSIAMGVAFAIALTVIQRGVGFVRGILFCRWMNDQELGQWSMIFSFLMLLAPLAVLGLPGCFGRYVEHYIQRGQIRSFVRRVTICSCMLTGTLAVSMFIAPNFFAQAFFRSPSLTPVIQSMAFALLGVAAINFLSSLLEALRQVRLATLMRFIQGVGFAVLSIFFVAGASDAPAGATIGFGLACFLACGPAIWFLFKNNDAIQDDGEPLGHWEMWKRIAPFAAWLWATNCVWNMFEVADRYMLVHWSDCSPNVAHGLVGQYHSGRVVPLLLVGVAVVLEGMIMPYMTVFWENGQPKTAAKRVMAATKLLAVGFTVGAILILACSPILFDNILQGKYEDGRKVLPLTLLFSVWFSIF